MPYRRKETHIRGSFAQAGQGIGGWVTAPAWLELLVDDCVVGIGQADLPEQRGYGFWIPLPPVVLESGGTVRVRVANTLHLIGEVLAVDSEKTAPSLQGEVHGDGGLTLSGWALDTLDPKKILHVAAWIDGTPVAETDADGRRYTPLLGDGHGFTLHLPHNLADGKEYLVRVQTPDGRLLPGSPLPLQTLPAGLADWIEQQKRLEGPQRVFLTRMVRRMESRLPTAQGMADYAAWKEAFPVPKLTLRQKCSLSILTPAGNDVDPANLLRKQKGVECCLAGENADYTLLMQAGELLHPYAVAHMISALRETDSGLVYADGEGRNDNGDPLPLFKPCWDRDAFLGQDFLGPMLVSRAVMERVRPQAHESYAALRVRMALAAEPLGIRHIPLLLSEERPILDGERRRAAVQTWLELQCPGARLEPLSDPSLSRVRYPLRATPRVSIIIPTRDRADLLRRCLETLQQTNYENTEVLIVDNASVAPDALALLAEAAQRPNTRILHWPDIFNYAAINTFAVRQASGELVCFLNNDTEIIAPDWLEEMVSLLLAAGEGGGCVGAKLLWPNGLVQHGGVVVGTHQLAAHIGNQWLADEPGYMNRNGIVQQYSAVTAACLLTSKALFETLHGFDAAAFPVAFNDVDYCLKVRAAGKKVLWTPFARLLHHESASRGKDTSAMNKARAAREMRFFRARWGTFLDPFYNPNLPLSTVIEPFYGLALPPRTRNLR